MRAVLKPSSLAPPHTITPNSSLNATSRIDSLSSTHPAPRLCELRLIQLASLQKADHLLIIAYPLAPALCLFRSFLRQIQQYTAEQGLLKYHLSGDLAHRMGTVNEEVTRKLLCDEGYGDEGGGEGERLVKLFQGAVLPVEGGISGILGG